MTQQDLFHNEEIIGHSIENEITQSYIDYAMSVIISRALPDVRDGAKPVIRRILYAMYDMKLFHNSKYRKSAAVVGEVLGKYHPHGDSSVYDAMVRMAQFWSMRYPLVDGQGNFGSVDGDSPAAMRYTEARMTKIAEEMLADIEQDTVDWRDNYDNSRKEPIVLPTKFPNHLCNGTMGIAVGMATNMAPHNLSEIIDASLLLIDNEEATIDEIMQIIKGPDFPTSGFIYDSENIKEVYTRGKGGIIMRGKADIQVLKKTSVITITELPYQVNKTTLVMKIGELIVDKKINGVVDFTDESNRDEIKITLELRAGVDPNDVLTLIYKYTDFQSNFNMNNIALIENGLQPRLLNIKDLLFEFVSFRRKVIYRRSVYQLNKAKDRLHILEGLEKAMSILDDVISTIRSSETRIEAKEKLIADFDFTDPQSEYILMMRLQTLVGLEIQKILNEIDEKRELVEYLTLVINDPKKLDAVVIDELLYMKDTYGDERRTILSNDFSVYELNSNIKDLKKLEELTKENVILWLSNDSKLKVLYQSRINLVPENTYLLKYTHNQDKLMVVTDKGELMIQRLKDLGSFTTKGESLDVKEEFDLKGNIVFENTLDYEWDYLILFTNKNNIKKVKRGLLEGFRKFPTKIMGLGEGEKIVHVVPIKEKDTVGVLSQQGMILMFDEENIRASGKTAGGVKGILLAEGDKVANMFVHRGEMFIFVYSDDSGKLLSFEDLRVRKRGRKGDQIAVLKKGEKIKGGFAIDDGALRIRVETGEVRDVHTDDIKLKDPMSKLSKITDPDKKIEAVYLPWEENIVKNWVKKEF